MKINKHTSLNQSRHSKTPKAKRGSSKANLQQLTKLKQTTPARRLPNHTNKVGGQLNDYWGLVHNSQSSLVKFLVYFY